MSLPHRLLALVLLILCVLFQGNPIEGAPIQPFEAVVKPNQGEDVYARSGPGKNYYPTQKMKDGDKVLVVRKDPGGWFVIEPPPGSFTWILADNVTREGNRGVINTNQSITRVGSQVNPDQRDVEQIRLNKGDVVEILGQDSFDLKGKGAENWYKIKPPRGERRWIKGSQLVELNPDGTPKLVPQSLRPTLQADDEIPLEGSGESTLGPIQDGDLSLAPSTAKAVEPKRAKKNSERPDPFEDLPQNSFDHLSPTDSTELAARRQFQEIDRRLDEMLNEPAYHWNLNAARDEFLSLRQSVSDPSLMGMIDSRIRKIERYEVIQNDAKSLAARYPQLQRKPPRTESPVRSSEGFADSSADSSAGAAPEASRPSSNSRFDGAGIIYKLKNPPPGSPTFVLIAPDRRILCYLESTPAINLDSYVGQSMGLKGRRVYDQNLRADRLLIQAMTPVRLVR